MLANRAAIQSPVAGKMLMLRAAVLVVLCAVARCDRYHGEGASSADPRATRPLPDPAEHTQRFWYQEAQAAIEKRARLTSGQGKAKNIVFFIGDGMSFPTIAAARVLHGQRQGKPGEESQLSFETFPTIGLSKTYCTDMQIPDSACTATAFLCGVKSNEGVLGLTAAVPRRNCEASVSPSTHLESIAAWAMSDGRDVGLVTTTRITHATPAGLYAKSANRDWESDSKVTADGADVSLCPDIAHQLIHHYPANEFKVILGGGRRELLPNTTTDEEGRTGSRTDNRNLVNEWLELKRKKNASASYLMNKNDLKAAFVDPPDYILGLFEASHLPYHIETDPELRPTLAEMTELAIKSLQRNDKGFFLFVESGRIDTAHHENYVELALDETLRLSDAVTVAAELLAEEDSLLVVSADHSHAMAFNGYQRRGGDILGRSATRATDGVPYMTLSYTNGPGARPRPQGHRIDVTADTDFGSLRWRSHAEVPRDSETHGGEDVGVFARGPHHELFTGVYEQSQLPHLMAYAGCIGPGLHACNAAAAIGNTVILTALIIAALMYRLLLHS